MSKGFDVGPRAQLLGTSCLITIAVMLNCLIVATGPTNTELCCSFHSDLHFTNKQQQKKNKRERDWSVNLQFAGFENNKHDNVILKRNSYSWPAVCLRCGILANRPGVSQRSAVHPKLITGGEREGN